MDSIEICWQCKHARWEKGLDLYEIYCVMNDDVRDENSSCKKYFEYDPDHEKINPRIERPWMK